LKDWDEHLPLVLRFSISQCPTPKININPGFMYTGRGSLNTNFLSTLLFIKKPSPPPRGIFRMDVKNFISSCPVMRILD